MAETTASPIVPRVLRLRDAPAYLGMDRNRFNDEVRPCVPEIRYGTQGVAFDRFDLDDWFDDYKCRNERRPKAETLEDDICLNATKCQDSAAKETSGTSRNAVKTAREGGSAKAREYLAALRQRAT